MYVWGPMKTVLSIVVAVGALWLCAACGPPLKPILGRTPDKVAPAGSDFTGRARVGAVGETTSGEQDLDGDGDSECWRLVYSAGNGFLGYTLTVRPGCQGAVKTLSTVAPTAHLLVAIPLPVEWRIAPALVAGAVDFLYGAAHQRAFGSEPDQALPRADPSLRWIRDVHRGPGPDKPLPFNAVHTFEPVWMPGAPELPDSQIVVLHEAEDRALMQYLLRREGSSAQRPGEADGTPLGLLVYRAHVHGRLRPAGQCGKWSLYTTGHAVAAHDTAGDSWAWVYVSSERSHPVYASVLSTGCLADLVVVEPLLPKDASELWVVAPDLGRAGRMPVKPGDRWSFLFDRQQLRVGGGVWALDDLREKLAR